MLLSNAVVLLLGALQPALGKPANRRQSFFDEPLNEIVAQSQMDNKTLISYTADNPGCADGVRAWVGVWPANASNPYTADYKARVYVEKTDFEEVHVIAFNNAELGIGEFKAAFVCDDDKRQAWMVSENFKIDDVTPAKNDRCIYPFTYNDPKWLYHSCDKMWTLCYDCAMAQRCAACDDCKMQCGQANTGDNKEKA